MKKKDLEQGRPQTISIAPIQNLASMKVRANNLFISGNMFDIESQSYPSYLNRYDAQLNLVSSCKLDFALQAFDIFDDLIYALGIYGNKTSTTSELFMTLYVMSLKGEIIEKIEVGRCLGTPTKLLRHENKIYFAYTETEDVYYLPNILNKQEPKAVLSQYNIETKTLNRKKENDTHWFPETLIAHNSGIYIVGYFRHLFFKRDILWKFGEKLEEKMTLADSWDSIKSVYLSDDELIVLKGFGSESKKYLKMLYINLIDNSVKEKILNFEDYGWDDANVWDSYVENETIWLIIKYVNARFFYVQISKEGKIISEIPLKNIRGVSSFLIYNQYQIQHLNDVLQVSQEVNEV